MKLGMIEKIKGLLSEEIEKETQKPFQVSIMGQTGVGKSSLLNKLFGVSLDTDDVKPCTKKIEQIEVNFGEIKVWFYDLPGIGESEEADEKYLIDYRNKLIESDVVLWAFHCDNRSVTFDINSLNQILDSVELDIRRDLISKITFVLTKADLIYHKPWILAKEGADALFFPDEKVENIFNEKIKYYADTFSFALKMIDKVKIPNDSNFNLNISKFTFDKDYINYEGILDLSQLHELSNKYPKFEDVFERLSIKNKIIPCSSEFKYNLPKVLMSVTDKIQGSSNLRFRHFTDDIDQIDRMPYDKAVTKFNLRILDIDTEQVLFDIPKGINKI